MLDRAMTSHAFSTLGPANPWLFSMRNSIFWLQSQESCQVQTAVKGKDLQQTRSIKV